MSSLRTLATISTLVVAIIAVAAGLVVASARWDLWNANQQLASLEARNVALTTELQELKETRTIRSGEDARSNCETQQVICPQTREVIVTPTGRRLKTAKERADFVRSALARRLDQAFQAGELEEDQRHGALDLLMEIRNLRSSGGSPEALERAQQELIELTGMGVGELLEAIEESPSRSRRPEQATAIEDGDERKRFVDETSRRLGIAEPGAVERFGGGEWSADE